MNKKLLFAALVAGLVGLRIQVPASALYIDSNSDVWYTVDEMLAYKQRIDAEDNEKCGDDAVCREEAYMTRMEIDLPIFWALEQLAQQQIVLTEVNPGGETVKVLFFNEDMMLKRMGISEHLELGEFYMGWFEQDVERIYNYGLYAEELRSDTLLGAHYLYAQANTLENQIPANEQFLIDVGGRGLNFNESNEIAYAAFAEPFFNAVGRFPSYASCLGEPDYTEGVECRLMISPTAGMRFFPPRETKIDKNGLNETTDSPNTEETANDDMTITADNPTIASNDDLIIEPIDDSTIDQATEQPIDTPVAVLASSGERPAVVKTPDTGAYTSTQEGEIELPWWLVVINIVGVIALIWLFIPTKNRKNHQNRQNVTKSLKKS